MLDLFHPGLPITHDGQDHLARIANFYQNLSEGNIIPRWAGNLNWGFGHPILMFLYPFPSYITSFFHFLGFSLTDSLKLVFGITFIASGIAMYLWTRSFLGELPGIFSGILYMFAPYRFVDLYVRGAIGEHVSFMFLPLILYFLFKLSKKYSYWHLIGGCLSFSGLFLSHNALSLMFLPFILFYMIYLYFLTHGKPLFALTSATIVLLGLMISSFFLIPAFFEGKYTLRDIVTTGTYASHFVSFNKFFDSSWSYGGSGYLSVNIGIIHLLGVILFPLFGFKLLKEKKKAQFFFITLTLLYLIFSLFLMLNVSNFLYQSITILQKFQFPWRFMSTVVFTTSILTGFVFLILPLKYVKMSSVIILSILLFLLYKDYYHAKDYLYKPDNFFKAIYNGTTDTGESAPIWSVRFMEKRPNAHMEVIEGKASIYELKRNSTMHSYKVDVKSQNSRLKENTLYFPGWNIYIDGRKRLTNDIQFQDPKHRGLMTFYVNQGSHEIKVMFEETKLRFISNIISIVGIALLAYFYRLDFILKRAK